MPSKMSARNENQKFCQLNANQVIVSIRRRRCDAIALKEPPCPLKDQPTKQIKSIRQLKGFSANFSLSRNELPYPAVIFDGQLKNPSGSRHQIRIPFHPRFGRHLNSPQIDGTRNIRAS
jgi:hypothetical protein